MPNLSYPHTIEQTPTTIVVALTDMEVGKITLPSTLQFVGVSTGEVITDPFGPAPTLEDERLALIYANAINDLLPKYIRKDTWHDDKGTAHNMIVMERIHPLPLLHFDLTTRQAMFEAFSQKLVELHDHHFVHGDLVRPTNYFTRGNTEWMFRNIIQTETSLRLIDAGFAKMLHRDGAERFVYALLEERADLKRFGGWFLGEGR
jgi:hypothetical protein